MGLAAGAAVAGVTVLIVLTVVVVLVVWLRRYSLYTTADTNTACLHTDTCKPSTKLYIYKHLCRRRRYREKENAGLPLQLTTVSPLPNEANCDESLEGSTQLGGAEYSTVRNTPCETVPVDTYGE